MADGGGAEGSSGLGGWPARIKLSSFTRFRDRADELIRDLKASPAGPGQVSQEQVSREQFCGGASAWGEAAVKYALDHGALIFAAVGNSGDADNTVYHPAATPGVVGVGAVGKDLSKTEESQYGRQVDLAAPGEETVQACTGKSGICTGHGTSPATALASASAALIWTKHPDWTNNQVLRVLLNTAGAPTSGEKRNDHIGYGIVRPRIALTNPGDPGPADEYPLPDLAAATK
ncbi:S8 family serine peptidase [Streptomyces sp. WMMC940]|uniref:S8 family serine peptidase n=1 Tax=Streptomyces sp. WMMC940 TaxID=3015153 RepID=UPI002FC37BD9